MWILYGDGSAGYSIAEYDTFRRFGVNPIALVGNDACWTQISREQVIFIVWVTNTYYVITGSEILS